MVSLHLFHTARHELTKRAAGFTYCAVGALTFLDRLPSPSGTRKQKESALPNGHSAPAGLSSRAATVRWLVARLTNTIYEEEDEEDTQDESDENGPGEVSTTSTSSSTAGNSEGDAIAGIAFDSTDTPPSETKQTSTPSFTKLGSRPATEADSTPTNLDASPDSVAGECTGLSGRTNKIADTCYAFWVGASLSVSNPLSRFPQSNPRPPR